MSDEMKSGVIKILKEAFEAFSHNFEKWKSYFQKEFVKEFPLDNNWKKWNAF